MPQADQRPAQSVRLPVADRLPVAVRLPPAGRQQAAVPVPTPVPQLHQDARPTPRPATAVNHAPALNMFVHSPRPTDPHQAAARHHPVAA